MKYRFHPKAEAELNEAVDYYEACQEGLGLELAREVHATIDNICEFPRNQIIGVIGRYRPQCC